MIHTGMLPAHSRGVRLVLTARGAALTGPGDDAPTAINETALALWELCDGETSVAEMIDAVETLFGGVDREVIVHDVTRTINDLLRLRKLHVAQDPGALAPVDEGGTSAAGTTFA